LESKKKQSAARISAIQTGAGESDAPLLGDEDAPILAIGNAEVVFDNMGFDSEAVLSQQAAVAGASQSET
jgi:hypothetical protein